VNADEKDVKGLKQAYEPAHPIRRLYDVLDDKIVSCLRECRKALVKSFEELRAQRAPGKFSAPDARFRQNARSIQVIDRKMPERLFEAVLKPCRDRRFTRARRAVEEDDLA
jgi:hypothetical protein